MECAGKTNTALTCALTRPVLHYLQFIIKSFVHFTTKLHEVTIEPQMSLPNAHEQQGLQVHAKVLAGFLTGSEIEHREC